MATRNPDGERPPLVFIMSPTGRSGTNYLRAVLISSNLCQAPLGSTAGSEDWMIASSEHLVNFSEEVRDRRSRSGPADLMIFELEKSLMLRELGEALKRTVRYRNAGSKAGPIVLKTPSSKGIKNFFSLFSDTKLILLVRDGRDTCQSMYRSGFNKNYEGAFKGWSDNVRLMTEFAGRYSQECSTPLVLWIKYEDLLSDPAAVLHRLTDFLEQDHSTVDLSRIAELPVYGSSELARTSDDKFKYQTVPTTKDFNPVGRWKSWPADVKELFKKSANQQLIDLGYETDSDW